MSDRVVAMYSVDTNVLMDWQARYYPTDVFQSLPSRFDRLIDTDRILAPALVSEELNAVGTQELREWAKERSKMFLGLEALLADALSIQNRFPGLTDPKSEFEEADAYVISLASLRQGTVPPATIKPRHDDN